MIPGVAGLMGRLKLQIIYIDIPAYENGTPESY